MNPIVIYSGKYGATSQYANWLADEFGIPVFASTQIAGTTLRKYDTFLIGSSVYIGKLLIKSWLKRNATYLQGKTIFFFQVAATPVENINERMSYNNAGIPPSLIRQCDFYFLPGKLSMDKLSWLDRFLLKTGARLAKSQDERKRMTTDYDDVQKSYLSKMINDVKSYIGSEEANLRTLPIADL